MKDISQLVQSTIEILNAAVKTIELAIDDCENDKEDDRYDALHDAKNRMVSTKKRLRYIKNAKNHDEVLPPWARK